MICPIVDSHCHLDFYPHPEKTAKIMEKQNGYIIAMTNLPSHYVMSYPFVKQYKNIRLSLGLHPLVEESHSKKEHNLFLKNIRTTSYIGEVGLDFSKEGKSTAKTQLDTFEFLLKELKKTPKFISLHSRGAEKIVLELLNEYKIPISVFHWYSGTLTDLDLILERGYYFSVNSRMIKSKKGKEILSRIPKNRILTETDGPNLLQNKMIEPTEVREVITFLSSQWMMPIQDVTCQIFTNFKTIVGKLNKVI